jgi:HSP20 family molecular chaperone IbpA
MDDAFSFPRFPKYQVESASLMKTDVKEFDDRYEMGLDLPGYKKEDISAELKDGYLTVNASHEESNDEKNEEGKYIRRERYSGKCTRSFYVGEDVKQEDIKACFEDGVLKLTIPKVEAKPQIEEAKRIPII